MAPAPPENTAPLRTDISNDDVARIFADYADQLELQEANKFRVRAYRRASRAIETLSEPIATVAAGGAPRLTQIAGIGKDLAEKILEILRTGTLAALAVETQRTPSGASQLMRVPGLGPKRARKLAAELGIRSREELEAALRAGRLRDVAGFGERSEAKLLRHVETQRKDVARLLRPAVVPDAELLVRRLVDTPGAQQVEIAGSYRRKLDTVGDLDVLVTGENIPAVIERFVSAPQVAEITARGRTRAAVRLRAGLQVDLRVLEPEAFGAGLHYFTGSKAHNIALRKRAIGRGFKLNEYGLWQGEQRIGGRTEEEIFQALGLPWIPPELREDCGEIEAAAAGGLPRLVELEDVRGDLQVHTTDSDGRHTLAQMAQAARERGYEWVAFTDHSPAVRVAGGMDSAGFRRQWRRIDELNGTLDGFTVLKGAEVDILEDGSLDLDDRTLAELDVVLISIHSKFDLPEAQQTRRVLRALQNPNVDVFAHPTGRRIGRRQGARFDLDAICRVARERGVALEVNGSPERMDLEDSMCRAAVRAGVAISFGSDAHSMTELGYMRWAVDQARRGWAEKAQVINTLPLAALRARLHRNR